MGRKSLAKERIEQILDAFERSIVQYGLDGATLQRVADEAGVKLSMINHYIGKREALVKAMVERFIERYRQDTDAFLASCPPERRLEELLGFYFSEASSSYRPQDNAILSELMALSERDAALKGQLLSLFATLEETFYHELRRSYPSATEQESRKSAYLILSLWNGHATLRWLGFPQERHEWAREAVDGLLKRDG